MIPVRATYDILCIKFSNFSNSKFYASLPIQNNLWFLRILSLELQFIKWFIKINVTYNFLFTVRLTNKEPFCVKFSSSHTQTNKLYQQKLKKENQINSKMSIYIYV